MSRHGKHVWSGSGRTWIFSSLGGSVNAGLVVVTAEAVGNRKGPTMAKQPKLTDTHLLLLSRASQLKDRLPTCPETLTGKAAKALAAILRGVLANDRLEGGAGDSILKGRPGADVLIGGGGADRFAS